MPEGPPRNYFPIKDAQARRETERVPHDRLDPALSTGTLGLVFDVLSPLHVGAGEFDLEGSRLVKVAYSSAGLPVVPGSSIKGACRQVYEALTLSGAPFDRDEALRDGAKLSAAAALFGTLGYQGRISFDDAVPTAPVALTEIKLSTPYVPRARTGRRFYGRVPVETEKTIAAQALPVGTRLATRVHFRNATAAEIGGLLTSLGVDHFVARLGGGKYDGYGCVRFDLERFRLRRGDAWHAGGWITDTAGVARAKHDWLAAFQPTDAAGGATLALLRERLIAPAEGIAAEGAP